MRKLTAAIVLVFSITIPMLFGAGAGTAHADTAVSSSWLHPSEYNPIHNAEESLGLSDAQFQKNAVGAVSFIFGVVGITNAPTAAPGGGNHPVSTTYTPTELQALDHVAGVMNLSRSHAQKVSAAIVAFLLSLS